MHFRHRQTDTDIVA